MIFLSHNYNDKDVVEPIAVKLKEKYGQENVFYDSWSIKPGNSIIGKMNEGLEKCKYFLYFISENSLNSSMVNLEWQDALYIATKGRIRFIPIKIDKSYPPEILSNTVYIDMYTLGIDKTINEIVSAIDGKEIEYNNKKFENIKCYLNQINENELKLTIKVMRFVEQNAIFGVRFSNELEDVDFKVISDNTFTFFWGKMQNYYCKFAKLHRALTPEFPFEAIIKCKPGKAIKDLSVVHQNAKDEITLLEIINL